MTRASHRAIFSIDHFILISGLRGRQHHHTAINHFCNGDCLEKYCGSRPNRDLYRDRNRHKQHGSHLERERRRK